MTNIQRTRKLNTAVIMTITDLVLLLAGIAFVAAVTLSGLNGKTWYRISVVALIVCYSVMYNITALYSVRAFEKMTGKQRKCYLLYMLFDVIALCFLALFVVNAGDFDEPFHYVALGVFMILTIPRHLLYHQATDELKEAYGRGKNTAEERVKKSGYNTISTMGVLTERGHEKQSKKKERFSGPELQKDRFVSMKLEGYVGGRSVDEKDNISRG